MLLVARVRKARWRKWLWLWWRWWWLPWSSSKIEALRLGRRDGTCASSAKLSLCGLLPECIALFALPRPRPSPPDYSITHLQPALAFLPPSHLRRSCRQHSHHVPALGRIKGASTPAPPMTPGLTTTIQERITRIIDVSRVAIHYGYLPLILYLGYSRSEPRPSLIR